MTKHQRYSRSAKGRARNARYRDTPKGRANERRWQVARTCAARTARINDIEEMLR